VSKGKDMPSPLLSYAQATYQALNILKIKEAFLALLDKKILEIHNAERVQKGMAYWDKQNNDVLAPNCMLKI